MAKELNEMNVAELKQLHGTLDEENSTPEQRAALQDFILDKIVEERVDAAMGKVQKSTRAKELDAVAKKRWPQLNDPESDFFKKVEAEVEARGDIGTNERALLDAANAVGMDLGEAPSGWTPSENVRKVHALKPSGDPDGGGESSGQFVEKHQGAFDRLVKEGYLDKDDAEVLNEKTSGGAE